MRCPSEPRELMWTDVDWETKRITVRSSKNERHNNRVRVMPLFPELEKYLSLAKAEASEGSEYVLPKLRNRKYNPATNMRRIVEKACGTCWDKVFQNCRSTRQTELDRIYPSHVVTSWLGNSEKVAEQYYLQVTDAHFNKAVQEDKPIDTDETIENQDQQPKQKAKQQASEMVGKPPQFKPQDIEKAGLCLALLTGAAESVIPDGFEPSIVCV